MPSQSVWDYPRPPRLEVVRRRLRVMLGGETIADTGMVAFYAGPMDACFVDDERVRAEPGGFYGGWITNDIVGPFKGAPGTRSW